MIFSYFKILIKFLALFLVVYACYVNFFVETKVAELSGPINGEYINIDGNKIYYQKFATSTRENVVLVGGTAAWSGVWEKTTIELRDKFNIYAIDLPPFGYSDPKVGYEYSLENQAKMISDFINQLNLKNTILVAHSYGAGPATEIAFSNVNIKKLILIDGVVHLGVENKQNKFLQTILGFAPLRTFVTKSLLHYPGFLQSRLESFVYKPENVDSYWYDLYAAPLQTKNTSEKMSKWVYDFMFLTENSISNKTENYKNSKIPVVLIWGEKDDLTPLSEGENLNRIIANSKLFVMKDTGHIPMIDSFSEFIAILKENL